MEKNAVTAMNGQWIALTLAFLAGALLGLPSCGNGNHSQDEQPAPTPAQDRPGAWPFDARDKAILQ
jgi:hypothetical protein